MIVPIGKRTVLSLAMALGVTAAGCQRSRALFGHA